jgi:xanthine dehydrogenase small subunit
VNLPTGTLLLDYVRYHKHLTGTKIGCREGDCGACTVLIGELKDGKLKYRSATSCLTPIGNLQGKHVVTIEGINMTELNPIQQFMCDEAGTQCGFCTPGFMVSMAGFCLSGKEATKTNSIAAIDGNICRCTGYKSIERAANKVAALMQENKSETAIDYVTNNNILPAYFATIESRLQQLNSQTNGIVINEKTTYFVGGGTDLYVQKHEEMAHASIRFLFDKKETNGIWQDGNKCVMGAATTVTNLMESSIILQYFPQFGKFAKMVSSTPIRNIATIAGNFINASPIGDFTIFFLTLNAHILLSDGKNTREIALRNLYKGYKQLDKRPDEFVQLIWFELPPKESLFNFEKLSKRTNLDIASVNSSILLTMNGESIASAALSAGGVGPIPQYLSITSAFLEGKILSEELVLELCEKVQEEIAPISDARGTETYKRLLLQQLIKAHFITLFPTLEIDKLIAA